MLYVLKKMENNVYMAFCLIWHPIKKNLVIVKADLHDPSLKPPDLTGGLISGLAFAYNHQISTISIIYVYDHIRYVLLLN